MKKLAKRVSRKRKAESVSTKVRVGTRAAAKKTASRTPRVIAPAPQKAIPIVGIGASAGGLEAMRQLLEALPTDTGMAFVLVQHLEPKHESMLSKLLAKATAMPVQEVRERMRVQPNQVYIIPANADLSLFDGLLHLEGRKALPGQHLPIDYFFHSLAETRRSQAIGVILSGTASDGTAGLRAIKEAGGITFAQQPETAKFDGMPRSAISAGCVDFVLSPERIAKELARIAHHPFMRLRPPEAVPALPAREEEWARLFRLLQTASGVDVSYYKKPTVKRRLARRMAVRKVERLGAYLKLLESSPEELDALFNEMVIGVTDFFRDPDVFLALREKILPGILAAKPSGKPLRIWVTGCSTGQEAYSIAISVLEHLGEKAAGTPIQIFGTDISDAAIEKARAGIYPEAALKGVSKERIRRFFTRINGHYQVNQNIREMCVFARHDVTKDPPFSKLDLISCRNVLIYFEPVLQQKALAFFHYALKSHGVLLLGKSESFGAYPELFTIGNRKHKFFFKSAAAIVPLDVDYVAHGAPLPHGKRRKEMEAGLDLAKETDSFIWERYSHAALVVNNDLQILLVRGDTSPYLRLAPGKAALQLLRMLRVELVVEVRAAIQKARRASGSVRREGIEIEQGRQLRGVNVEVRRLLATGGRERCFLILFEEASLRDQPPATPGAGTGKKLQDRELLRVRNELAHAREYVQAIIRDQESTNDELKTVNEEALSNMEELQSTNEELETSKEELQSSNEELVTVNEQLQNRNAELAHRSDELTNVLNGAGIPILILDSDRGIRLFTPPAEKVLGLLPTDVGRPIGNLRLGVLVPDLEELISTVIGKASEVRREVQNPDGRWYALHIRPFWTGEKKIEGVLMAFVDVHEFKQNKEALQKERNFITAILDAAKDLLVVVLDHEGRIVHFNRVCQQLTGYSLEEVKGRVPWDFLVVPEEAAFVHAALQKVYGGTPVQRENHWLAKDGRRLLISWLNSIVRNNDSPELIETGTDVTDREAAQVHAQESDSTVRAMMETASQAILAVSQSGRIMMANPAAERMYGYGGQELVGLPIKNLMPERYRERYVAHLMKWFSHRPMSVGMKLSCLRRDSREFPAEVSLCSINTRNGTLGVAFIADITERKENERTLLAYQRQLQTLAAGLIAAQESGNRELARELHDVFSQDLAGIGMEISSLKEESKSDGNLAARLSDLAKKITRLATEMHRTSREIHPAIVEELGLEPALRQECEAFQQRSTIQTQFSTENVPAELPEEVALCLYRVAQESLRNIHKHSPEADWVHVSLEGGPQRVTLRIEDAGDGFELDEALRKGGLGLISMEERIRLVNGELTIQSQPGKGTTVTAFVPLENVSLKKKAT